MTDLALKGFLDKFSLQSADRLYKYRLANRFCVCPQKENWTMDFVSRTIQASHTIQDIYSFSLTDRHVRLFVRLSIHYL